MGGRGSKRTGILRGTFLGGLCASRTALGARLFNIRVPPRRKLGETLTFGHINTFGKTLGYVACSCGSAVRGGEEIGNDGLPCTNARSHVVGDGDNVG